MAASKETVYIKADRNVEVTDPCVKLGDILSMECANPTVLPKLKTIKLLRFHGAAKKTQNRVAVSILKVIECIHAEYPEIEVQNLGEQDFIITYEEQQSVGGVWHILKTSQVVLISFMGAAFSIMAFNNDVGVTDVFAKFYQQITGMESNGITELEICYSIGLAVGIIVFFNHVGHKKITHDPTPIQIEMRKYETDLDTAFINNAERRGHSVDVD